MTTSTPDANPLLPLRYGCQYARATPLIRQSRSAVNVDVFRPLIRFRVPAHPPARRLRLARPTLIARTDTDCARISLSLMDWLPLDKLIISVIIYFDAYRNLRC